MMIKPTTSNHKSFLFFIGFSFFLCIQHTNAAAGTPFLKEIVTGRCYDNPPTGNIDDCPSLVPSLLSVLESRLDQDITAESFDTHYLDFASSKKGVDVSSRKDKALIFLQFNQGIRPQQNQAEDFEDADGGDLIWKMNVPEGLITPEKSPGGALMDGLVFCGIDQMGNCNNYEKSNAYEQFWESLYRRFAISIHGHLQVIVQPFADTEFLKRSIIDNIDPNQVANVTLYGQDCSSPTMIKATEAFKKKASNDVVCNDNLVEFILCGADDASPECMEYKLQSTLSTGGCAQQEEDEEESNEATDDETGKSSTTASEAATTTDEEEEWQTNHQHHHVGMKIFFVIGFLGCIYCCICGQEGSASTYEKILDNNNTGSNVDNPDLGSVDPSHSIFLDPEGGDEAIDKASTAQ